MRTQDLIPAFLEAIQIIQNLHAFISQRSGRETPEYEAYAASPFGPIPSYVMDEGDNSEWWDSEDAYSLLQELFDILESYAPEGFYFGSHPGDGSDFGFWEMEEE
jgi:hypothetical protein